MDHLPLKHLNKPMTSAQGERFDQPREDLRISSESNTEYGGVASGGEEDVDDFIKAHDITPPIARHARTRLFLAFLLFGLLNNVLYVIILSAALDLVSSTTPKGVVAFFNILPAVLSKVCWPLLSKGQIQYGRRVALCTFISWLGILTIAFSSTLYPRLFGISLASLSSGLGELTFLQLTTTLPTRSSSRTALGAWSSGTGMAGIAGAGIWWLLRSLGVKVGLGISSFLPLCFPATYLLLLPPFSHLQDESKYQPLPTSSTSFPQDAEDAVEVFSGPIKGVKVHLSVAEKVILLKPLILRYMIPLCAVYIEEYVINSGVAPTLVFPVPTYGIWSKIFKSPRDYYPFWSLTYQTFVFLSRSSLSLGLPPIPKLFLPLPSILQFFVLLSLTLQSKLFIFSSSSYTPPATPPSEGVDRSISFVFLFICMEGLCGGSAYVNTFYHVGREGDEGDHDHGQEEGEEEERRKMEREFRIGAVGAADSLGILFASLISMPVEIALCESQVAKGRTTCRDL